MSIATRTLVLLLNGILRKWNCQFMLEKVLSQKLLHSTVLYLEAEFLHQTWQNERGCWTSSSMYDKNFVRVNVIDTFKSLKIYHTSSSHSPNRQTLVMLRSHRHISIAHFLLRGILPSANGHFLTHFPRRDRHASISNAENASVKTRDVKKCATCAVVECAYEVTSIE